MLCIGKQPESPSLKQKIMFWKGYRSYIKNEINRLRHVAVSQFRQLLFKGKFLYIYIYMYMKNCY